MAMGATPGHRVKWEMLSEGVLPTRSPVGEASKQMDRNVVWYVLCALAELHRRQLDDPDISLIL